MANDATGSETKAGQSQLPRPPDLAQFTVGFVNPDGGNKRLLGAFGSGTLVASNQLRGVLTAAHVLDGFRDLDEIALVQFPARGDPPQRVTVPSAYLDSVRIGQGPWSASGPDLAFITLPDWTAELLLAHGAFLNFEKHAELAFTHWAITNPDQKVDAVLGVVREWSNAAFEIRPEVFAGVINALHNVGHAAELEPSGEFDRLLFTPLPETDIPLPRSYAATSGGGLWRALKTRNISGNTVTYFLLGVAFYENTAEGSSTITCQGPVSIYRRLGTLMQQRWP
jgi:hypothetical protein